jgi:hypothetical protein
LEIPPHGGGCAWPRMVGGAAEWCARDHHSAANAVSGGIPEPPGHERRGRALWRVLRELGVVCAAMVHWQLLEGAKVQNFGIDSGYLLAVDADVYLAGGVFYYRR